MTERERGVSEWLILVPPSGPHAGRLTEEWPFWSYSVEWRPTQHLSWGPPRPPSSSHRSGWRLGVWLLEQLHIRHLS